LALRPVNVLPGRLYCLPGPWKKWFSLIIGVFLLYAFAFLFLPFLSGFLGFTKAHGIIIEEKIEAGAFFYTGVEKIREIETYMRSSQRFVPSDTGGR